MRYSIKQIAGLASVTTRTIRYYDQIGLLPPAETGENGYRYYDRASLLKLQQILFFRELDMPLEDILSILSHPDYDPLAALQNHRVSLNKKLKRLQNLVHTLDQTISSLKGENNMTDKELFEGFDETQYEDETRQRWGSTPQYAESQRKWKSFSAAEKEAIKQKSADLITRMCGTQDSRSDDPDVQAAIAEYFSFLNNNFYTCDVQFLRNLADMWVSDPRFAANYERIRAGGAAFTREAVHYFCDHIKQA